MNTKPLNGAIPHRKLIQEITILSLLFSTLIIISVLFGALLLNSSFMNEAVRKRAHITADETVEFLKQPLWVVQDDQAVEIGKVLLSSGRVSGIYLETKASGVLLNIPSTEKHSSVASITKEISFDDTYLGTVTLDFSDGEVRDTRLRLIFFAVLAILTSVITNFLAYRYVIRKRAQKPLDAIFAGIDAITEGNYETEIALTPFKDVNAIIQPMNEMALKISQKKIELLEANNLLERRVAERTVELQNSLTDLRQAHEHLLASEKLSTLGYLSAGVAHELNTPLGAIVSSNRLLIEYLDIKQLQLIEFLKSLNAEGRALYDAIYRLGITQATILEVSPSNRKRAKELALELAAAGIPQSTEVSEYLLDIGIAENVPTLLPLLCNSQNCEILSYASALLSSRRMAEIVSVAALKASQVVSALRAYIAPNTDDNNQVVDVDRDIETVLVLMNNMLKHGIQIHREYSGAHVIGSSDKLSQVWMNIIRNAAQAMNFTGDLFIQTKITDGLVYVSIVDSGPGIPPLIQNRIFEPFFTTKKQGEGMGLGLDICRKIIEALSGTITVTSEPGRTEFTVILREACRVTQGDKI